MKTAISIPDQTYQHAEILASELGLSRSALYTKALEELIERKLTNNITEQLNQIYADNDLSAEEQAFVTAAARATFKRTESKRANW